MVDVKKVSWNASEGLIMELSNRRTYANNYFVNGNIKKAMSNLIAIKQSVIQSFNKDEREKLKKIEQRFNKFSKYLTSFHGTSFNSNIRDTFFQAQSYSSILYAEYNDTLMDLLEKYGYLIGEKSDASMMRF